MTWFKVDDTFHAHPKVLATDADALGLWVVAGAWSSAHLTDGFVPTHVLPRLLPGSEDLARKLVANGLWLRTRGGYRFHDWLAYQPSRVEASVGRDGMSSGGALGNHRRWHVEKGKKNASCRYCQGEQDSAPTRVPDDVPESGPNPPVPARPGPYGGRSFSATHDRVHADSEPPLRCLEHLDDADPPPCGACRGARQRHEAWTAGRLRTDAEHRSANARSRADATRDAIEACRTCDTEGRVNGYTCRHDTRTPDIAARGAAAVRAQIGRPPRPREGTQHDEIAEASARRAAAIAAHQTEPEAQ